MNNLPCSLKPPTPPRRAAAARGFTLIECIGVVTVVAVVAAMLVPTVIRRLDQAARTRDAADLNAMMESLKDYIVKTKSIPSNLSGAIATNMALPLGLITKTPRKTDRSFLIDPAFSISGGLPYKQATGGTTKPASARILILSSLESNAPSGNFDTWWSTADTDSLRIKRLNVEPMFHQLMLVNRDSLPPKFAIDTNSNYNIGTSGVGTNAYYLDGSLVSLYNTNSSPGLVTRHLLTSSISFVFEGGAWHSQIIGTNGVYNITNSNTSQEFANAAAAFFATNWNPGAGNNAGKGANQSAVLAAMYNYMSDYTLWASLTPTNFYRFGISGGNLEQNFPIYQLLSGAAANIDTFTGASGSGNGPRGLLYNP